MFDRSTSVIPSNYLPPILITLAASEKGARTFKLLIIENPIISISIMN
jgi:hypothetical protein